MVKQLGTFELYRLILDCIIGYAIHVHFHLDLVLYLLSDSMKIPLMLISCLITVYSLMQLNRSIASVLIAAVLMVFLCYAYGLTIAMAWILNWDLNLWNPDPSFIIAIAFILYVYF